VSLATVQPFDARLVAGIPGVLDPTFDEGKAVFRTDDISGTLRELLKQLDAAGIEIAELQVRKATLEDVFLALTEPPGSATDS
jgi:hypothetical protein